MKMLKPGDPCPCCGSPLPEGLPTETMMLLSRIGEAIGKENEEEDRMGNTEKKMCLRDVPVGGCVKVGEWEFVVLEHCIDSTPVILKDFLHKRERFGNTNNYAGSHVDELCERFADALVGAVGAENLVEYEVDLTSDDGLKDYGSVRRKVSLMTADQYRKYVEILDKHKINAWWWLATPWSTPTHNDDWYVKCVAPSGIINFGDFYGNDLGVRPFCIFKSDIFVSQ